MQLEEFIQNKLNTFEYSNNASDWNAFEKKLPKKKISISKYIIGAAATIIIATLSIYFLNDTNTKTKNTKTEQISKTTPIIKKKIEINKPKTITNNTNKEINNNKEKQNIIVENKTDNTKKNISEDKIENNSEEKISDNNTNTTNEKETNTNNVILDNYKPNSNFVVSNQKGCSPLNSNFTAKENHKNISYKWEFSDGYKSNKKTVKHIFKKAGEYTVKLITEYKNNKTSISEQTIIVYPTPKADFTYTQDEDAYYFDGPDKDNLTWKFGDNTNSSEIDPEHIFKLIGKTNVELTVKNEFGCSATKEQSITIEPVFKIANAFSPDNNGFNDAFGPIFEYPENYDFELYIYNAQGKLYFKSSTANQSWNGKINNTEQLAEKGYYLWKLIINDKYGNRIIKNGNLSIKY